MKRVLLPSIWLLVVALLAAGLSSISGLKFWWAFLIVAGAILINGWVATLEDDLPGGGQQPRWDEHPKVCGYHRLGRSRAWCRAGDFVYHRSRSPLPWVSMMHLSANPTLKLAPSGRWDVPAARSLLHVMHRTDELSAFKN
jgi:hypothetical protein